MHSKINPSLNMINLLGKNKSLGFDFKFKLINTYDLSYYFFYEYANKIKRSKMYSKKVRLTI